MNTANNFPFTYFVKLSITPQCNKKINVSGFFPRLKNMGVDGLIKKRGALLTY